MKMIARTEEEGAQIGHGSEYIDSIVLHES
jgi:hypothetical protein